MPDIKQFGLRHALNTDPVKPKSEFTWAQALFLTKADVKELRLVKGCAMKSGEMKRGEIFTELNVAAGTGAMSMMTWLDVVPLDIDHHEKSLPKEYIQKYGAELAEIYPPGFIFDSAVVRVQDAEDKHSVECQFVGIMLNKKAYEMAGKGKFVGCSVVDFARNISNCGDGKCDGDPVVEGSHFIANTLVLDEVPNSNGTYISCVDESDEGTIFSEPKNEHQRQIRNTIMANPSILKNFARHISKMVANDTGDTAKYMTEGKWNSKDDCVKFLVEMKHIPEDIAKDMGAYMFDHVDDFTTYQLEALSGADLIAWFTTLNDATKALNEDNTDNTITQDTIQSKKMIGVQKQLDDLKYTVAKMSKEENMDKHLIQIKNATALGDDEGGLTDTPDEGMSCGTCRYFTAGSDGKGECMIRKREVMETAGCERHEAIPDSDDPDDKGGEDGDDGDGGESGSDGAGEDNDTCDCENKQTHGKDCKFHKKNLLHVVLNRHTHTDATKYVSPKPNTTKSDASLQVIKDQIKDAEIKLKQAANDAAFPGHRKQARQAEYEHCKSELKRLKNLKKKHMLG